MIAPGGCSKIDKYWQVDILLDDSMSLDASLFPAIFRITASTLENLREQRYRRGVHDEYPGDLTEKHSTSIKSTT